MTPKEPEKPITKHPEKERGVVNTEVSVEMKKAYLDYAMSVIVSRAIPSIEDGLKPVQRRILYAMQQLNLKYNTQTKKSARVVGDVIGKYHPHGDSAVYEAMVRMAQNFSLRYPLVYGQGNFGCFTADTEVKLTDGRNLNFVELIKEHNQGKRNFTFTVDENNLIRIAEIKNPRKTKEDEEIMKVVLDNGEEVKCTLNHKFMLRDGSYKEAKDLESGDSLMPLYLKLSTEKDKSKPSLIGYNMIYQPKTNNWGFCHNLADDWNLVEEIYQRNSGGIRHHIDFNKLNNDPDNIKRVKWEDHWKIHSNHASKLHEDEDYKKKISEGRKRFWSNKKNREAYSKRMTERNLKNWKKKDYREKMSITLSEVNKRYLKEHPEVVEEISRRATITMTRLWKISKYKELFNKKIIESNKRRTTNLTGKKKFLTICNYLKENSLILNKENYENIRRDVFGIKSFTSWDLGIEKYYDDRNSLLCEINGNHKVVGIEILNEKQDVYDITIDKTHNFSLASGIFVHNSVDGDPPAAMRYCVTGDTLILTEKGVLPIEEISAKKETKINLKILSFDGKKNTASKFFNSGKHKTIKIKTQSGYSVEGSYNHPLLTWILGEDFKPKIAWRLLEELKEGDVVILNRENNLFSKFVFNLKKYIPKKGFKNDIKLPLQMNGDLAFLLGALVSEGSFHNNQILFNNKDKEFYDKVKNILLSQFKGIQLYERKVKGNCTELSIYEQKAVLFLKNIGLKDVKSHGKEIPFSVLRSKKEHLKNFLVALFEGDGSVQKVVDRRHGGKSIQLTYDSKSEVLIKQLKTILLGFGVVSNNPYQDKRNSCFKLYVSSKVNIDKFFEEIGFFSKRKNNILKDIKIINSTRLSKNDFIPFLNDYLRVKYNSQFIIKNNFDRYNSLTKNYSSLIKIIDKQDKIMVDWILKNKFYFDQIVQVEKTNKLKNVYSVKVDSNCHSFVANGFINHNTEAKLKEISEELLQDLDKETVKFVPNYDGSMKEPFLLPGKLPALILNGATGIAVGMSTNIPPHNLTEVCDAITEYIDKPNMTVEQIVEIIQGPDFPTGGVVQGDMIELYKTGRGRLIMRGKATIEERKKKEAIIITEIPYMVNKATLITQIANLVRDKKIKDISDLRDESSKGKIRIVLELRRGVNSKFVMNALYKYTRLQDSFNVNFLALVGGQPKILGIRDVLEQYVKYRKLIITKRINYNLKKAQERQEIVQGLLIALKSIDEIIKLIKKSKSTKEASDGLIKHYKLTERQAKAILETKLQQLTSMEQDKLKKESLELKKKIEEYEKILKEIKEVLKIIKKEVKELRDKYGDARRTQVLKRSLSEISEKDLVQKKEVVVSITDKGYVKRMDIKTYKEQRRGGKGVIGSNLATGDFAKQMLTCSTHDYLMFFTSRGRVLWLKAYDVPEAERYSKGKAVVNLLGLKNEIVTNVISVKNFEDFLMMATKKGQVKRIALSHFSKPRASGVKAINLPHDDNLIGVEIVKEKQEVLLATKKGKAIKFDANAVRAMGRASYGVTGIKFGKDDEVVSLEVLDTEAIFTITKKGYGKRTSVQDYRKTSRAGKGVINLKISDKTGVVVNTVSVNDSDSIIITTAKGIVIRTSLKNIRVMGRAAQGVRVVKLQVGDSVTDVVEVQDLDNGDDENSC